MPRLILIVSKRAYNADAFVAAARAAGADVTLATDRCHQLDAVWGGDSLVLDYRDTEAAAQRAAELARPLSPAAVLGTDDHTAAIASRTAELLGLPGNAARAARDAANKLESRTVLAAAGVPVPAFFAVPLDGDVAAAAARAPYPCVLKPLALSASRGVIRADGPAAFAEAFARIRRLVRSPEVASRGPEGQDALLVEAFVPGPEVALEGLMDRGALRVLALFDKPDPLDGPFFEETLYVTPSRLDAFTQREIARVVESGARALGLVDGPVHAELRVSPSGPVVLEIAARTVGGLCGRTLRFGAGVSLEELVVRHALGEHGPLLARERRPAGVMMLPIPRSGTLLGYAGVEAAKAVPGVEDVVVTAQVGAPLVPLPEGDSYLGFAFARGDTPEAVERSLRAAAAKLTFDIATRLPLAAR